MQRRQFLSLSGLGLAGFMLPNAQLIAAEELLAPADVAKKKLLADTVLALAKQGGASYCDVRIGRYLNQAIVTREDKVQNVTNSESAGVGIRVIVNG
ncbi:MAG: TldD/PmbA family protein, partial [Massilia sp.]